MLSQPVFAVAAPHRMRIATWNLDRPSMNRKRRSAERADWLRGLDADILVLTETTRDLRLIGYSSFATVRPVLSSYRDEEAYAAIHSRYPMTPVDLPDAVHDPRFAVCAKIDVPGSPIVVHGSIITYHNDGVASGVARPWERHREAVRRSGAAWIDLRKRFPDRILVAAGDFNQVIGSDGGYQDAESQNLFRTAFDDAGLVCLTGVIRTRDGRPISRRNIDHIAISMKHLSDSVVSVWGWEGTLPSGTKLSDHNGSAVDIHAKAGSHG